MPESGIAIANSDPALLGLLQDLFNDEGYEVATYITDGTTHAKIRETQPRLLVLDAGMYQSAAGWGLLKLLQFDPKTKHIPVLITTVDHRFIREKAALLQGLGYDVLELPASMAALVDKVGEMLARAKDA